MLDYIDEQGWHITGDALQINYIDDNLTDHTSEFLYEIQIPIKDKTPLHDRWSMQKELFLYCHPSNKTRKLFGSPRVFYLDY